MKTILRNILIVILILSVFLTLVSCGDGPTKATDDATPPQGEGTEATEPDEEKPLVPDYPPMETESNQTPVEGDPNETLPTSAGQTGVNLTYSSEAKIDLSEEKVTLYFVNPTKSLQNMMVSLEINGIPVCRSKIITPGNKIESLPLIDGVAEKLSVGGYNAEYSVGCYDPQTHEKAIVELVGAGVVVTVVE